MLCRELLASGHLTLKGKSHLCQVCLKFILTPAHQYLHDGQHHRKVHLVINFLPDMGKGNEKEPFSSRYSFCFPVWSVNYQSCDTRDRANPALEFWGYFGVPSCPGSPHPVGAHIRVVPRTLLSVPLCLRPCWMLRSTQPHTMQLPGNGLESELCGIFVMAMPFMGKTVTSSSFCRFCNPSQPATDSFMNFYSFGSIRER